MEGHGADEIASMDRLYGRMEVLLSRPRAPFKRERECQARRAERPRRNSEKKTYVAYTKETMKSREKHSCIFRWLRYDLIDRETPVR